MEKKLKNATGNFYFGLRDRVEADAQENGS